MGMTWARSGCAVMVVDAIGYGERRQQAFGGREDDRWRYHMGLQLYTVGESLMAWMVADLRRGVLRYLQSRPDLDGHRVAVWGESFAPVNPPKFVDPPMQTDVSAQQAEPMGAMAALLLALFQDDVHAVAARGGLIGYAALMNGRNRLVGRERLERYFAPARTAYCGGSEWLTISDEIKDDVAEWLSMALRN